MQKILEGKLENKIQWPMKTWGSGGAHKNILWLNMRNPTYPDRRGIMKLALNDYYEAFSVR